ncbi:MAG: RluA family pseudouridine synthase [Rhodocyclales bacterium]|nr:RluA family pseudouridine synthase [Rhodocyclales bacterium]
MSDSVADYKVEWDGDDEEAITAEEEVRLVPIALAGERLDRIAAELWPEHSRSRLQAWIEQGWLTVDGVPADSVRRRLLGGERLALAPPLFAVGETPRAQAMSLSLLYADESIFVIDKPAGLVVHPGAGNLQDTLLNGLLALDPALAAVPRAGIVHRLDKDTSGLMVVARTLEAQTALVRQLQARTVRREYWAVVAGHLERAGTVQAPIGRHPRARTRMAVVPQGKPAVTHYRPLEVFAEATLIECRLETGRTHQIRVHLAHLGFPLLGDPLYAPRAVSARFSRQALHARRLALVHPASGKQCLWESPLPEDMVRLLDALRGGAR